MNVGKSILNDIEEIQWSVMNEKTFRVVYETWGRGVQEQVELSQYELIRENNIREREEVFRNLNIADDVVSCKEGLAEAPGKDKTRGKGNKRKKEVETHSPRRLRSRK